MGKPSTDPDVEMNEDATNRNPNKGLILKNGHFSCAMSFLIVAILPNNIVSGDYECGINRFNNESPLTERIVGGNNSLQ